MPPPASLYKPRSSQKVHVLYDLKITPVFIRDIFALRSRAQMIMIAGTDMSSPLSDAVDLEKGSTLSNDQGPSTASIHAKFPRRHNELQFYRSNYGSYSQPSLSNPAYRIPYLPSRLACGLHRIPHC